MGATLWMLFSFFTFLICQFYTMKMFTSYYIKILFYFYCLLCRSMIYLIKMSNFFQKARLKMQFNKHLQNTLMVLKYGRLYSGRIIIPIDFSFLFSFVFLMNFITFITSQTFLFSSFFKSKCGQNYIVICITMDETWVSFRGFAINPLVLFTHLVSC